MKDDGVAWDARSRALVHPRRGSPVMLPKMDAAKAWTRVRKAFAGKTKAAVTKGRKLANQEDRALTAAAIASFAKKSPPEKPDAIVEGVRAQLLGMEAHFNNMESSLLDAHDALVHLWCIAYGVPFAVAAMRVEFAYDLLDVLGAKAFALLKRFYEATRRRTKTEQKKAFAPLMLVTTDAAREWLRRHAQDPVVGSMLR